MQSVLSIDAIARRVHESWRSSGDRSYSPFNRPWNDLKPEDRKQISRQARITLDAVREHHPGVKFIDEYEAPGPGDVRWNDPAAVDLCCGVMAASPNLHQMAEDLRRKTHTPMRIPGC